MICSATTFVSPGYIGTAVKCRMCMHLGPSVAPPKEKKTLEEEMADMGAWGLDVALDHASRTEPVVETATVPVQRRAHLAKEAPIIAPVPIRLNHLLAREDPAPKRPPAKEAPAVPEAPKPRRFVQTRFQL